MNIPYFFVGKLSVSNIELAEETSKHIVNVIRMKKGQNVLLTDGKGNKGMAILIEDNRKKCIVQVSNIETERERENIAIGISLIKNSSRFEWFLEKVTEIGIKAIFPLICERTEKERFRMERMQSIIISAMLQSQQAWMPVLSEPMGFKQMIQMHKFRHSYIAHCLPGHKDSFNHKKGNDSVILIGPEGDFTKSEIQFALSEDYEPVSLGNTRLRTETAGIVAATLIRTS